MELEKETRELLSEFDDWHETNIHKLDFVNTHNNKNMSQEQKLHVKNNAKLLSNKKLWKSRVDRFIDCIKSIPNKDLADEIKSQYSIHFDGYIFGIDESFLLDYIFPCNTSFTRCGFKSGMQVFEGAEFLNGYACFDGAVFHGATSFIRARFSCKNVSFRNAIFHSDLWMHEASFFNAEVHFNNAIFESGSVSFYKNTFLGGEIQFDGVEMRGHSFFFTVTSLKSTKFSAEDFRTSGNLFLRAKFQTPINLRRLQITGSAVFSDSEFAKVPDFRDSLFERPPEVGNMKVPQPELKRTTWRNLGFLEAKDPTDVEKFRKLKSMAVSASDHEMERRFFASEMLAKRGVETRTWLGLAFNSFYWKLSEFGRNFQRPAKLLALNYFVFGVFYFLLVHSIVDFLDRITFSLIHALINIFPLTGAYFGASTRPSGHISAYGTLLHEVAHSQSNFELIVAVGIVQNLIGTILFFLFLLGLRNNFRLH